MTRIPRVEWERHRDELKTLYLHENKTLDEVRDHMLEKHSFDATPRVYKAVFKAWGWSKYVTRAKAFASFKGSNESSVFQEHLYGTTTTLANVRKDQIRRHIKRCRLPVRTRWPMPTNTSHVTKSPIRSPIRLPESLNIRAFFLTSVRNYIKMSVDSEIWTYPVHELLVESSSNQQVEKVALHNFINGLDSGCSMYERGHVQFAGLYWRRAFREIETIIYGSYHDNLPNLLLKLAELSNRGYRDVAISLLRQISNLARAKNSPQAAIYHMLGRFSLEELINLDEVMMEQFIDLFEQYWTATSYNSFVMRMNMSRRKLGRYEWSTSSDWIPCLDEFDSAYGPLNRRSMDILALQAKHALDRQQHRQASTLGANLVARADSIHDDSWLQIYYRIQGYHIRGKSHLALKEYIEAEADFESCLEFLETFATMSYGLIFDPERMFVFEELESLAASLGHDSARQKWASQRECVLKQLEELDEMEMCTAVPVVNDSVQ